MSGDTPNFIGHYCYLLRLSKLVVRIAEIYMGKRYNQRIFRKSSEARFRILANKCWSPSSKGMFIIFFYSNIPAVKIYYHRTKKKKKINAIYYSERYPLSVDSRDGKSIPYHSIRRFVEIRGRFVLIIFAYYL